MATFSSNGRLANLRAAGVPLSVPLLDAVSTATLDTSRSAATQITLTIIDPTLELLNKNTLAKTTPVTYAGLKLTVAVRSLITVGSTPALQVKCRPAGWRGLKTQRGAHTWSQMSYTTWAKAAAARVGMGFVGEESAVQRQIIRAAARDSTPQNDKDVLDDGAKLLGFVWYECAGVLFWGRPSWLAANLPTSVIVFDPKGPGSTPGLVGVPQMTDSDDDEDNGYTGSISVTADLAEKLLPSHAVALRGVGPFSARYLVDSWSQDLTSNAAITVQLAAPVNPTPEPTEDVNGDSVGTVAGPWVLPVEHYTIPTHGHFGDTSVSIRTIPHQGLDFSAPTGTAVRAVHAGTIIAADPEKTGDWYGNRIRLRHNDGTVTWYCHLSGFQRFNGDVDTGDVIGFVGATGNVTGPHLHFEVHPLAGAAVDPEPWLRGKGLRP